MNRPSTAATNSAVDMSCTRLTSQPAGTIVRYGSTAKPTTIQAIVQAARMNPAYATPVNSPVPAAAIPSPTRAPSAAPRTRMVRITLVLRASADDAGARDERGGRRA